MCCTGETNTLDKRYGIRDELNFAMFACGKIINYLKLTKKKTNRKKYCDEESG